MTTWTMPAEPGLEVTHIRDAEGHVWEHVNDPDAPWQFGRVATTWPLVLTRGPLTDASNDHR